MKDIKIIDCPTPKKLFNELKNTDIINELEKCFQNGNDQCDGPICQGCWKDIVHSVINRLKQNLEQIKRLTK